MSRCLICESERNLTHEELLEHLRDDHGTAVALTSSATDARTRRARVVALATGGSVMLLAVTAGSVAAGLLAGLFARSRNLAKGSHGTNS